jgi:hypothetical protein
MAPTLVPRVSFAAPAPSESVLLPVEDPFFVGALLGFASTSLDFGVGARVGKTFLNGIYVGASFIYQNGQSEVEGTLAGQMEPSSTVDTNSLFYTGVEGGYDFNLKYVVVRPFFGVGIADITEGNNATGTNVSHSFIKFVLWPGIQATYNIPHSIFFIGADLHLLSEPGGPSIGFFGTGGVRFGASD